MDKQIPRRCFAGVGTEAIPETAEQDLSVTGNTAAVSFYAASLLYRDKVTLRFYFKVSGDADSYTFAANGVACEPVQKGGYYVVDVAGITPENLDAQVQLTVTSADSNVLTVCYSPMNYMVRMNKKGSDSLKALLKALYNYHLAAKALRSA